MSGGGNLLKEYSKLNWAPFVLGLVITGLETGWIFAYKNGWQISIAQIVEASILSLILIILGILIFHETLTWNRIVGIIICLIGLIFINLK